MAGERDNERPQTSKRSSIACARCRKSKVKCVNEGIESTCTACNGSGRNCQYPSLSNSASRRPKITAKRKQEDVESPKIVWEVKDSGRGTSSQVMDPLDAPVLTKKVWDEVYDIFKLHFSTELPFLYPPAFRNLMRQASNPRDPSVPTDLQDGGVLLLAVLTLTARFHPQLLGHHASNGKSASEYYATALKTALDPVDSMPTGPSLCNIQAILMLGLYEWGQTRGLSAWILIGNAIRLAQAMKLPYEDCDGDRDFDPTASCKPHTEDCKTIIGKEVKRRTLWSCFIMDRMLSAGKYRSTMISVKQLKVQLPCSDDDFLFIRDIATDFLDTPIRAEETLNDDRVLARYVRLVELFGRLSEWSCCGGRRTETLPPWDSSTQFFKLQQELEIFYSTLPSHLIFTTANLSAHIEKRNAMTYASMHTLYSLCVIILHREYIPFIPLLCTRPQGPLDAPVFPENQYHIPNGFWEKSAESIFKAARDIVDIVRICQDYNTLPDSPQIGFSVWQAAFVCLYAVHFPHMDVGGYMRNHDHGTVDNLSLSVEILKEIVSRLGMAKGYLGMLGKMHEYFSNIKTGFQEGLQKWSGTGGLESYKTLEKELKDFGSLHNTDESVAANCISPANESDNPKVILSQGYQHNTDHQHSSTPNPTPSSLPSGLLYAQDLSYHDSGQQQHRPSISAGQHILASPTVYVAMQNWSEEVNVAWAQRMNANAYNNNAGARFDGSPADMQTFDPQNYEHIPGLWSVPNTAEQGGFR